MNRRRIVPIIIVLCLLCGGCQRSSVRNVLIEPETDAVQADQGLDDGELTGIHSIPLEMTVDGQELSIQVRGWMDQTRLWCETSARNEQYLSTVDDSYGFVKKIEGVEYQNLLGVSPDGRYAVFVQADAINTEERVVTSGDRTITLYDGQSGSTVQVMQVNANMDIRPASLSFSGDGRYMSFLIDVAGETDSSGQRLGVYDLIGKTAQCFDINASIYKRGYIYCMQIMQAQSINEMNGWLLLYDIEWGGQCNALYVDLMDGKMVLAQNNGLGVLNLQASCKLLAGEGLMIETWSRINQGIHWYDGALLAQTFDEKLVAVDLSSGNARIVADSVSGIAIAPDGQRVAICKRSSTGSMEVYTAHVEQNANSMLSLVNMDLVYTGRHVSLGVWNQNGSKLLIYEVDENEKKEYYRVLTFYTE